MTIKSNNSRVYIYNAITVYIMPYNVKQLIRNKETIMACVGARSPS